MRYHIDTIPVWDAVKLEGECPLCALRRKVEKTDVERYLGLNVLASIPTIETVPAKKGGKFTCQTSK